MPQPGPRRGLTGRAVAAWGFVLAWAGVVWWLGSEQFGGEGTSRFLVPVIRWLWPDATANEIFSITSAVRTVAHPTEYAILALLALRAAWLSGIWLPLRMAALAVGIAASLALLDELRQERLPTRVGSAGDWTLDVAGAVVAVVAILWLLRRRGRLPPDGDPVG